MKLIKPTRRSLILAAPAILLASRVDAFWQSRDSNYNISVAAGGGGSASYTAIYGDGQDIAYGSSTYTSPSQTWTAGYAVVFISTSVALTGVTIKGVSATKYTSASKTGLEAWYALITAGAGTVVATAGVAFPNVCSAGGVVTSTSSSPSAGSIFTNSAHSDPQTFTAATVPSGGIGIAYIAVPNIAATGLPTIWSGATRDAVTESSVATGNTQVAASAHTISAGSFNPTVSGSGPGFGYQGAIASIVTWGP